jgi:hypothetical protein
MASKGLSSDLSTLNKLKDGFINALGLTSVAVDPTQPYTRVIVEFKEMDNISDAMPPLVDAMLPVLDASHTMSTLVTGPAGPQEDSLSSLLVGSLFVDAFLGILCSTSNINLLPNLTIKSVLEGLAIIVYKQDFERPLLRPLQPVLRKALVRTIEFMVESVNFECQQQALSVVQAYVKRWSNAVISFIP